MIGASHQASALELNGSVNMNTSVNAGGSSASAGVSTNATATTNASSSAAAKPTMSQLQQKIGTLSKLTDTERSVLSANLKVDSNLRLLGPEISILATIERVDDVIDSFKDLYSKLQDRVSSTSTVEASYMADMNTKLIDAKAQVTASQNLALTLKPDQGNKTLMQKNLATLKDARDKVKTAIKDINDARRDAALIISIMHGSNAGGSASTTLQGTVKSY